MSYVGCVPSHLLVVPTTRASTSAPLSSSAKLLSTSPLLTRSSPRTTVKTMAQSQPSSNQQGIGSGSEQQKVVISNNHGEKLVGILHETGSRELVVFCHGFRSSKETITGVNLAAALTKEGISAFRFDFSGNGESEGSFQYGNYRKEADDLRAVVQYFSGGEHEVSAIAGHSKGGNVVLLYASMYHDIPTVVNISGRYALDKGIGGRLGKDFMQTIKKDGYIDVKDKTGKVEYRVTEESLMDRLSTDMHAACLSIDKDCRVLTVHGSVDEIIPVEDALEIAKLIPNHKLHVIEGADHGYTSHQAELISTVLDFIRAGLQQGGQKPSQVLKNVEWPENFPFKAEDFQRFDESPDTFFYSEPRFVTHIDDPAIRALTKYYSEALPPSDTPGVCLLDLCSSWVSHFPAGYKQERIVGMGMNEEELKRNPVLTEYVVQDLNVNPKLPFEDNSFDVITNVVSVDYLTKPMDVFKEMERILKPGGLAIMSFSNRCFWTKAISIWTSTGDSDHVWIVGSYFHYAGGFEPPQAVDISPNPGRSDPMYIVYSRKVATA